MDVPTAHTLLELWERGRPHAPAYRALLLLAAASPESAQELASLPLGQRNQRLFGLRQRLFGDALACVTPCPACGERLELPLGVSELLSELPAPAPSGRLRVAGYSVRYRLPTSLDLLELPDSDAAAARRFLLSRCVLGATCKGEAVAVTALPDEVQGVLSARMAAADPQAVMALELRCPACRHCWSTALDIASFLWSEVEHWATRLLREVHCLASAYGWREADILSLTPQRRQAYLELIAA